MRGLFFLNCLTCHVCLLQPTVSTISAVAAAAATSAGISERVSSVVTIAGMVCFLIAVESSFFHPGIILPISVSLISLKKKKNVSLTTN